jgi:hypothetical protein
MLGVEHEVGDLVLVHELPGEVVDHRGWPRRVGGVSAGVRHLCGSLDGGIPRRDEVGDKRRTAPGRELHADPNRFSVPVESREEGQRPVDIIGSDVEPQVESDPREIGGIPRRGIEGVERVPAVGREVVDPEPTPT